MQKVYCQSLISLLIMTDSLIVVLAKKKINDTGDNRYKINARREFP